FTAASGVQQVNHAAWRGVPAGSSQVRSYLITICYANTLAKNKCKKDNRVFEGVEGCQIEDDLLAPFSLPASPPARAGPAGVMPSCHRQASGRHGTASTSRAASPVPASPRRWAGLGPPPRPAESG